MATMKHPPIDFGNILTESKRVINSHSRHFLALAVLFLLPFSFSLTAFPILLQTLSRRSGQVLLRLDPGQHAPASAAPDDSSSSSTAALLIAAGYLLLASSSSLCAVGSITFSVFHGLHGRPVKLVSAIKSLYSSLIPLFVTSTLMNLAFLGICFAFALLVYVVFQGAWYLGFQISYDSPYMIGFYMLCSAGLVLVLVYLQMNWALAGVVVVLESTWGLSPLSRSAHLVNGMKKLSLSLVLFFGVFIGMLTWISLCTPPSFDATYTNVWKTFAFVMQIMVSSALTSLLMLHDSAATAVFYMYCKAMHGELAEEITEEFAGEYFSLAFDAEKAPDIGSII